MGTSAQKFVTVAIMSLAVLPARAAEQPTVSKPRDKYAQARIVHFPKDRSIGHLYIVKKPLIKESWWHYTLAWEKKSLGEARGDVKVPADGMLRLDVVGDDRQKTQVFAALGPNDIQIMNLSTCNDIDDYFMSQIGRLTGLEVLFIAESTLTSQGLKHLTNLKQLKAIALPGYIRSNELSFLSELNSLEYLHFAGPMVTDDKMPEVGTLVSLTQLSLTGSDVGKGLAHLKALKSLRYLNLQENRRFDIDAHLGHLSDLTSMEELDLRSTQIGDAGLAHIAGLTRLRKLYLSSNPVTHRITPAGIVHLKDLKAIEELDLPADCLDDAVLAYLARLPSLKNLSIRDDRVTDKGLKAIAGMKSLEELYVLSKNVSDDGVAGISKCTSLKSLGLSRFPLTDKGLAHLANLKSLEKLLIKQAKVTGDGLAVLKKIPALKELELYYLNLGETGTTHIADAASLETLSLHWLESDITDQDLA